MVDEPLTEEFELDPIETAAATAASAIARTLATEGWDRLKALLLRIAERTGQRKVRATLAHELETEERRLAGTAASAESRLEIEQAWAARFRVLLGTHPEMILAILHAIPNGNNGAAESWTIQSNNAYEDGTVIAPAHGDVNIGDLDYIRRGSNRE